MPIKRHVDLSVERVRYLFDYDGRELRWKNPYHVSRTGEIAGRITTHGYRQVTIWPRTYHAQRLIWLWQYGVWPKEDIDHINGIKLDNRLENLREATRGENIVAQDMRRNNTSGCKNLFWESEKGLWRVVFYWRGKRISVGRFKDKQRAQKVYRAKAIELHGEFVNLSPGST